MFYFIAIPLLIGLLLDTLLGDPRWRWHPVCIMGGLIAWCEKKFNQGPNKKRNGVWTALLLCLATWLPLFALNKLLLHFRWEWLYYGINSVLFFFAICNRSLIAAALHVERAVQAQDLPEARKRLSMIVGRSTAQLDWQQIRTATLETLAENLSDGLIAPIFFYLIGGIPLMYTYKMINTMDSMIGYRSVRYKDFGWFAAAVLDDGANYIPARLTAFFMAMIPPRRRVFYSIKKYAHLHASPNSGYPEAALAGILKCRFGGPARYHGEWVEKAYLGEHQRSLTHRDVLKAVYINAQTTVLMSLLVLFVAWLVY